MQDERHFFDYDIPLEELERHFPKTIDDVLARILLTESTNYLPSLAAALQVYREGKKVETTISTLGNINYPLSSQLGYAALAYWGVPLGLINVLDIISPGAKRRYIELELEINAGEPVSPDSVDFVLGFSESLLTSLEVSRDPESEGAVELAERYLWLMRDFQLLQHDSRGFSVLDKFLERQKVHEEKAIASGHNSFKSWEVQFLGSRLAVERYKQLYNFIVSNA